MIFLKKIEAKGFKSYANPVVLDLNDNMVGVVGPNGAGKSNVIDAIKWVLGEKSHKALRGKKSDDMIFHGSQNAPASEYAEVSLTFDNSSKVLYSDLNEIVVTRRLYRGSGNNEYMLNGKEARLKDIQDIFLDTGLSKGSLCIISQGTVNWFADAKPEERRKIFEEAAGIGRYTKTKQESLRQLERAQANYNRVKDIVKELDRDLKKLETQAEKLKKYKEYRHELTELELKSLVKDVIENRVRLEEINKKLSDSETNKSSMTPQLSIFEKEKEMLSTMLDETDNNISEANLNLQKINDKMMNLEIEKSVFENDLKSKIDSKDINEKIEALNQTILNIDEEIKNKRKLIEINEIELKEAEEELIKFNKLKEDSNNNFIELNSELSSKKTLLSTYEEYASENSNIPLGAKTIIENKDALSGVHGIVSRCIQMEEKYEKAISTALGSNINNIIVNTNGDAKKGIEFLKNNKAGTATFMPIYNLSPKYISQDYLDVASQLSGYIDIASNLVKYENKIFKTVIDILLARTFVVENIDSAIQISEYTKQAFKIVTLDGDVISPGGVVKGGFNKQNNSLFNLEEKIEYINNEIKDLSSRIESEKISIEKSTLKTSELQSIINEKKNNISKYNENLIDLEKNISYHKAEYHKISETTQGSHSNLGNSASSSSKSNYQIIIHNLNNLNIEREGYLEKIKINEEKKNSIKSKLTILEQNILESRKLLDHDNEIILKYKVEKTDCENIVNNAKEKILNTYKMTLEFAISEYNQPLGISDDEAKDKIRKLYKNIEYLGDINMQAANELSEKKERKDFLQKEYEEAEKAMNDILEVIDKSDQKAIDDFGSIVDRINAELPEIFKYLFGGGSCKIEFTDKDNLLETGIDVLASPPGKKINSLFALSGGEKTLVALSVLFSILKTSKFPLVILDEAESALDPSNVERFGNIISHFSNETQFLVITHRPGTMERCDSLYGATMETKGITNMFKVQLKEAKEKFINEE